LGPGGAGFVFWDSESPVAINHYFIIMVDIKDVGSLARRKLVRPAAAVTLQLLSFALFFIFWAIFGWFSGMLSLNFVSKSFYRSIYEVPKFRLL
jgi:hypothetical protein